MKPFSSRFLLSCGASIALSLYSPLVSAEPSSEQSLIKDIQSYITADSIAVDPVLLRSDDISAPEQMNRLIPSPSASLSIPKEDMSPIEALYSKRLRERAEQFGYGSVNTKPLSAQPSAAFQDSYVLESGDEVNVLVRGGRSINITAIVNPDGTLIIEDLPPVSAAGRTVKAVREELLSLVKDIYNTDLFLSVGKTRQIAVTVAGEVGHPSQVTLSTYNTVIDALASAGGIKKTGSLRQIKLLRGDKTLLIDLYGILIYGSASTDISLRDGDRIQVMPIGPTIAVSGSVTRPGIYEILPASRSLWHDEKAESQKLTLDDVLNMAGGTVLSSATRFIRLNINDKNVDAVTSVGNSYERIFGSGDILVAGGGNTELRAGNVELTGASPLAGSYALAEIPSLSHLLKDETAFGEETYPLLGIVARKEAGRMSRTLLAFSPQQIIAHKNDLALEESDTVVLLTRENILSLETPVETENPADDSEPHSDKKPSSLPSDIRDFLIEHGVFLRGSIRSAGTYPIAKETTLDDLLETAGGTSLEADIRSVEITQPRADKSSRRTTVNLASTSPSLITLHPGDTIRVGQNFRRVEDRHVSLGGEVKNPGTYDLIEGDTLATLIARAGGLTEVSYPEGAVFSRKSERLREEQRYKSQARMLELGLAAALQEKADDKKPSAQDIATARDLIAELKNTEALGRITVEADPAILETHPELNILLESGDKIFIPKRPLTVRVAGEVLSPAALQFRSGKSPHDYINEAGGLAYNADEDRAFVVYPNGSAQPLSVSAWNYNAIKIPPGSTIIVPRDPKPLSFMDGAKDLSQILANLATSAIFVDDITNGN